MLNVSLELGSEREPEQCEPAFMYRFTEGLSDPGQVCSLTQYRRSCHRSSPVLTWMLEIVGFYVLAPDNRAQQANTKLLSNWIGFLVLAVDFLE